MEQWYQCPRCGKDVLYGANPCPYCKCPLTWSRQGPVQYLPPAAQPEPTYQPQQTPQYQQPEPPKKKSNKLGIIALAVVLVALAAIGSCVVCVMRPSGSESPASTPGTTPVVEPGPKYWAEVIRWEGNSIKDTETFSITANYWRIRWNTWPGEYGDMNFQIYIYDANGNLKNVAANVIGTGSDVSYVRGAGNYYLTINSGQPYTVIIEQEQ